MGCFTKIAARQSISGREKEIRNAKLSIVSLLKAKAKNRDADTFKDFKYLLTVQRVDLSKALGRC